MQLIRLSRLAQCRGNYSELFRLLKQLNSILTIPFISYSDPPMHQQPLSLPVSSVVTPNTNNVKQKSLLRKNRQTPAPFELNVPTSIDPSQNRLPQFGDDLSKTFGSVTAPLVNDKNNVMKPNFLEEFKLVIF